MSDNTERIKLARASLLEELRPWAAAIVGSFVFMFAIVTFLVTRASAQDLEKVTAQVVELKAARAYDVQRLEWFGEQMKALGEQMREVAVVTRARLVPMLSQPSPAPYGPEAK